MYGAGRDVGDTIVRHPAIQAVSFTGSNDVGVGLYSAAAARGIKCQCEMGGKNPIVVLADADLGLAVESTLQGAFGSTGQRCTATSRAVVVDGVAREFLERLEARTASLVVGNGLNPATHVGPSVDGRQLETVMSYVETGRREGARLVCGGNRTVDEGRERGFFVAPAIFDGVDAGMRIAQEEIFGPCSRSFACRTPRPHCRSPTASASAFPPLCTRATWHPCSGSWIGWMRGSST